MFSKCFKNSCNIVVFVMVELTSPVSVTLCFLPKVWRFKGDQVSSDYFDDTKLVNDRKYFLLSEYPVLVLGLTSRFPGVSFRFSVPPNKGPELWICSLKPIPKGPI